MLNKDFLRDVFMERKGFLKLSDVKWRNVPFYDELSVKSLWPDLQKDKQFMYYMPSKLPKGRVPDREYMFNILNTIREDYLNTICNFANKERNDAEGKKMEKEVIEITEGWLEKLKAVPFISSKSLSSSNFS